MILMIQCGTIFRFCLSKRFLLFLLLFYLSFALFCQESDTGTYVGTPYLSFKLKPGVAVPLLSSTELFSIGGKLEIVGEYRILPFLYAAVGLNYGFLPVKSETEEMANLLSISAGPVLDFELAKNFNLGAYSRGGGFYGFLSGNDPAGSVNPFVQGGISASYRLVPFWSLGIELAYRHYFGLMDELTAAMGVSYHFHFTSPAIIEVSDPDLQIFPVLFKFYDRNPISTITIRNTADQPISNITVNFFAREFMINPRLCAAPFRLSPGEEKQVEVYALFTDKVLTVSEGTKVSSNITVDFLFKGKDYSKEIVPTLDVISRNGIVWDDDRKASCFVTAKDPAVLRFARTVSGLLRDTPATVFDDALLKAMVLNEALSLYGLAYALDPTTPYTEFSKNRSVIDFLQFPNQTLEYKGGDCDDLSILRCALLESLGIGTAFITVPGHIFMAFRLTEGEQALKIAAQKTGDFIIREDGVWVPVEVTSIDDGFLKAWQLGAQQWNEATAKNQAAFYPVHDAWELYEPVGFSGMQVDIDIPSAKSVLASFEKELDKLIKQEVGPKIASLKEKIAATPDDLHIRNRLGVLYAKYGMPEQAIRTFNRIIEQHDYTPALINLGNVHYLSGSFSMAREYYKTALNLLPDNPRLLLVLIRVEEELQNSGQALAYYNRLKELSPQLAEKIRTVQMAEDSSSRSGQTGKELEALPWQ